MDALVGVNLGNDKEPGSSGRKQAERDHPFLTPCKKDPSPLGLAPVAKAPGVPNYIESRCSRDCGNVPENQSYWIGMNERTPSCGCGARNS